MHSTHARSNGDTDQSRRHPKESLWYIYIKRVGVNATYEQDALDASFHIDFELLMMLPYIDLRECS